MKYRRLWSEEVARVRGSGSGDRATAEPRRRPHDHEPPSLCRFALGRRNCYHRVASLFYAFPVEVFHWK